MCNLKPLELTYFEDLLNMKAGYVLNLSDAKFKTFVAKTVGLDIEDIKYCGGSSKSKANRLRQFIELENNHIVYKVLDGLLDIWKNEKIRRHDEVDESNHSIYQECRKSLSRLIQDEIDVEALESTEEEFSLLVENIRISINSGQVDAAIDRLHTYMVKFIRGLCTKHNITYTRDDTLHHLFGEYRKCIVQQKSIESDMTLTILKTATGLLDKFNDVRNNQSLAHDNPVLNYNESLYIFNTVVALKVFIDSIDIE